MTKNDVSVAVQIEVRPVQSAGEEFFLVSFIDEPQQAARDELRAIAPHDVSTASELEKTVEALIRNGTALGEGGSKDRVVVEMNRGFELSASWVTPSLLPLKI